MGKRRHLVRRGRSLPRPTLRTARLVLEPVRGAHAGALHADLREPLLYVYTGEIYPQRIGQLRAHLREAEGGYLPGSCERLLLWAARTADGGRYVGLFEATIDRRGRANLGYMVFTHSWGRGYATEACSCVVEHLLADPEVTAVVVITAVENRPARRVAERLGFELVDDDGVGEGDAAGGRLSVYVLAPGVHAPKGAAFTLAGSWGCSPLPR